jgi:DNA-binding NarL/FixJ family response regulator
MKTKPIRLPKINVAIAEDDPLRREKEVLKMLVAGRSNKEIAAPLGIEERTVKAHVAEMMRKLGVRNRIALSVHAITDSIVQGD